MEAPLVVLLVPFPAQGHITPMLQLAAALRHRGFHSVLVVPDFIYSPLSRRLTGGELELASIPTGGGGERPAAFEEIDTFMERDMAAGLERLLVRRMEADRVACVVVDLLVSSAIGVAERCGLPAAGFWPAMEASYRLIAAIPRLIREAYISENGAPLNGLIGQFLQNQPKLPTLELSADDLPWIIGNPKTRTYRFHFWLRVLTQSQSLPWIISNSIPDPKPEPKPKPEPEPKPEPCNQTHAAPHLLPMGPLLSTITHLPTLWDEDDTCLSWLNTHPPSSVIYASFGSWVPPFGPKRVHEIALGLEAANRPFLWVLKEDESWRRCLPAGYIERVAPRGKVVSWAPQRVVLKHKAVGCYLTHCGWNSMMEAILHGKRMVCHPIAGDQFLNCGYVVKVWGVGIRPRDFGRDGVRDAVERVMGGREGEGLGERVAGLGEWVVGEGGSLARKNMELLLDGIKAMFGTDYSVSNF